MAGPEFFQTGYGRRFFEKDLPELVDAINRLAAATERLAAANEPQEITVERRCMEVTPDEPKKQ